MTASAWGLAASTGLPFTHSGIVDVHFEACFPTYRALLHEAGIRPGDRVLDAGCGSGSFLPLIVELTGPGGGLAALDLAPEHVEETRARVAGLELERGVEVVQGTALALPWPDDTFDVAWCANTVQYLDDGELRAALAELVRVTRPGGVVAVKELDPTVITARPGDPFLFADFFRRASAAPGYARQLVRARDLYRHLAAAGLTGVRQHAVLSEHFAPFTAAEREFYGRSCAQLAGQAADLGLGADWAAFADPADPRNPLHDPEAYICEGSVLATGTVEVRP